MDQKFFGEMQCGYCHEVGVIFLVVKELGMPVQEGGRDDGSGDRTESDQVYIYVAIDGYI